MGDGIVDPAGRVIKGPGSAGGTPPAAPAQPMYKLGEKEALLVRTGLGDDGWSFYPDVALNLTVGGAHFPVIYWFEDHKVFKASDYRSFGVPMQLMVVPKPPWWDRREQAKHASPS